MLSEKRPKQRILGNSHIVGLSRGGKKKKGRPERGDCKGEKEKMERSQGSISIFKK